MVDTVQLSRTPYTSTSTPRTVVNQSRDLDWGCESPATDELALNILNHFCPPGSDGLPVLSDFEYGQASTTAFELHKQFARDLLVPLPDAGGVIDPILIDQWILAHTPIVCRDPEPDLSDLDQLVDHMTVRQLLSVIGKHNPALLPGAPV